MTLIAYAGKDPDDIPYSLSTRGWDLVRYSRSRQAYNLWRRGGWDTASLAEKYEVQEPTVLRWITKERSKMRSLPDPYAKVAR